VPNHSDEADPIRELIVIGGGEHGRVVIDAARSRPDQWRVIGFLDRQPCEETVSRLQIERLGSGEDDMADIRRRHRDAYFVLGIGAIRNPEIREGVVARFQSAGTRWATVVHHDASVSSSARLGDGTVAFARVVVNTGARVGAHCVINSGAIVEHDVIVGDYSQMAPGSAVGGGARIGSGTYLGLGSRLRDHVRVGNRVFVAMGSVVIDDVADGSVVMGVPARPRRDEDRRSAGDES
jgi:sugar O-acyltransferase (sialic acid O-acetyltransferase NeuD family)